MRPRPVVTTGMNKGNLIQEYTSAKQIHAQCLSSCRLRNGGVISWSLMLMYGSEQKTATLITLEIDSLSALLTFRTDIRIIAFFVVVAVFFFCFFSFVRLPKQSLKNMLLWRWCSRLAVCSESSLCKCPVHLWLDFYCALLVWKLSSVERQKFNICHPNEEEWKNKVAETENSASKFHVSWTQSHSITNYSNYGDWDLHFYCTCTRHVPSPHGTLSELWTRFSMLTWS